MMEYRSETPVDPELRDAMAAVFTPTPLDLLDLMELRRTDPETAMRLATEAGRKFDRDHTQEHAK